MSSIADKLTDLDFAILGILPAEGARTGHHTYAKQVISIAEELGNVTAARLNGRVRSLKHHGLVVSAVVPPVSTGLGWQITPLGQQVLQERRQSRGATIHTLPWVRGGNSGA